MRLLIFYFLTCFLLLSSGCVFAAARFNLRYEEALPISVTAIMLFLFVFGLLDLLPAGVYVLCAAALLLYGISLKLAAGKGYALREKLFTPSALLFFLSLAALFVLNYGRMVQRIDEMTHWADTVKAMYYTGLLSSAKAADTFFPSYPPGMALMEYLFLRLYVLFDRDAGYTEWVMYVAFQCCLLSFLFPFLRSLDFKKPLHFVLAAALVFLCPLMMDNSQPYSSLYIDPFLCAVFGGGLAAVFSETRKDRLHYDLYVFSACTALVLAKPVGLLFVFFLVVVYTLEQLLRDRRCYPGKLLAAAASVALPLGLWSLKKTLDGVTQSFSSKEGAVDLHLALRYALHREGDSWQQLVHDEYYRRILTDSVRVKGFACPYWLLLLFSVAVVYMLLRLMEHRCAGLHAARRIAVPSLLLISLIYYVSLCYTYLFKFDWWEAVVLASLDRYIGIVLYALYTVALLSFVRFFTEVDSGRFTVCAALAFFLLLSPFGRALAILRREDLKDAEPLHAEFRALAADIQKAGDSPSRVLYIFQDDRGWFFYDIHYLLRPNSSTPYKEWYLGPSPGMAWSGPLYDRFLSPEEWLHDLQEHYDYLYLMHIDDYFLTHYSDLFDSDSPPVEKGLYRVGEQLSFLKTVEQG